MEMLHKSVNDFTAALASRASVPGGGSASALAGALAAALGGMVGELTVGKEKYAAVEPILRELLDEAETLRGRLLDCVEKDAAALAPLAKAYAIPKGRPAAGRNARGVPCCRRRAADGGAGAYRTDGGVAARLCRYGKPHCGLGRRGRRGSRSRGASQRGDQRARQYAADAGSERAAALDAKAHALVDKYARQAEKIYNDVYGRLAR